MSRFEVTMVSDLSPSTFRRWYVLEGEYGGEIFATVPACLVPGWVNRRRISKLLGYLERIHHYGNWLGGSSSCYVVADHGVNPYEAWRLMHIQETGGWDYDPRSREFLLQELAEREAGSAAPAHMSPWSWVPETHLPGWLAVGAVSGGMGGGVLLEDDLWLHSHVLCFGLEVVNEIRRLLGLKRLASLEITWEGQEKRHADFCHAFIYQP